MGEQPWCGGSMQGVPHCKSRNNIESKTKALKRLILFPKAVKEPQRRNIHHPLSVSGSIKAELCNRSLSKSDLILLGFQKILWFHSFQVKQDKHKKMLSFIPISFSPPNDHTDLATNPLMSIEAPKKSQIKRTKEASKFWKPNVL